MLKPILFGGVFLLSVSSGARAVAAPCVPSGAGAAGYVRCREEVQARLDAAEALLRDARDMPEGERAPKEREAAQMLLDGWSDGFAAACRAGEAKWCQASGDLLYRAAHAFRWSGDRQRAREVLAMLLAPENGLADSSIAARALFDTAVDASQALDFERAATAFEAFAAKQPKDEHASDALENAFVFRVALGDLEAAEKALDALARTQATSSRAGLDFLAFGLADALGRAEDWAGLERFLAGHERLFEKARDELALRVAALRAKAFAKQGKAALAEAAYARISSFAIEALVERAKSEPGGERAVGRALEAIGDAAIARADRQGAECLQLTVKQGDRASLEKKEASLARAERAYLAVLAFEPVPPPRQAVTAAARVARLHGQLWAQVQIASGESAAAPYLARAKSAYEKCVDLAAKFQVDPANGACAAWLGRHYPGEHHVLSERLPALRANGASRPPPPVLGEDGVPIVATAVSPDAGPR